MIIYVTYTLYPLGWVHSKSVSIIHLFFWDALGLNLTTYVKFSKITYFFLWLYHKTCGTLVPQRGIEPGPRQWKHWLPTTGLPGNAQIFNFFELKFLHLQNSINLYYREFLEIIIGNTCHTPHSLWPFPSDQSMHGGCKISEQTGPREHWACVTLHI